MSRRRKQHSPEQIVRMLRDADAMLAAGKMIGDEHVRRGAGSSFPPTRSCIRGTSPPSPPPAAGYHGARRKSWPRIARDHGQPSIVALMLLNSALGS